MSKFYRPVSTKCWIKFLKSLDCHFKRQKSSHHVWYCPGTKRSVVFRGEEKEIPAFHIKTNLKTLEIDEVKFWEWIDKNC